MTSDAAPNLAETNVSLQWQQLSEHLDAFISAWQEATQPPTLADFLPSAPPALRHLTLVEAIKVDLEYRWQDRRWPKLIEGYLQEFPELAEDGGVPSDIIYEEYHVRKQRTGDVATAEYFGRFPDRVEELRRLFALECPEATATLVSVERVEPIEPGQRIDDFDLLSPLGKGAFASVFLARQVSMQRLVALKVSSDRGFEPQTLAQLDHPNIVRVYDQRQLSERKMRLLYMQYVPGGTLHSVNEHARQVPATLRCGATLLAAIDRSLAAKDEQPPTDSMTRYRLQRASWAEAICWIGARLAAALAYAHHRGVLHRDVKPANVLVSADGQPKLADFNISFSKLDGATPAAYFGGSLAYMSPEQLEACDPTNSRQPDELDGRSDIYSLGVMLWEMLMGSRPFAEADMPKTWSKALSQMAILRRAGVSAEARQRASNVCSPAIVKVLLRCLAPEPDDRYPSANELARQLDLCLQPRAQALLESGGDWRRALKHHPVAATILIGLIPNVVMCLLNIAYNMFAIMPSLNDPDAQRVFFRQMLVINPLAYTIGVGYIFFVYSRLFRTLGQLVHGNKIALPLADDLVHRCFMFGATAAGITATLWAISGLIFPGWMHWEVGLTQDEWKGAYGGFFLSNLLCGLIAATQTYYIVTFFAVRYCYPWLLQSGPPDARDLSELAGVARRGRIALGITVAVPFLALLGVAVIKTSPIVLGMLGGLGLVGCGLAYWLDLTIRGDLAALAVAINPSSDALTSGDTLDSFLTGTRR